MRAYDVRCMERSVGLLDKIIKSTKEPGKNADKPIAANRFHSGTNHLENFLDSNNDYNSSSQRRKAVYVDATIKRIRYFQFNALFAEVLGTNICKVQPSSSPPLLQNITVGLITICINLADESILCLVDIAQGLKLTSYGYPFDKTSFGVDSNGNHYYYVCDVSEIVCPQVSYKKIIVTIKCTRI